MKIRIQDVAAWCSAELVQGSDAGNVTSVSIDTRTVEPGALFVAIRGPNHDAHDFLADAIARGAAALMVESKEALPPDLKPELPVLCVSDGTVALGALAAGYQREFSGPVVAITGSNGKTSTKEMCAAILERLGPCLRNRGNLNNAYGLPLTLLAREAEHQRMVVELGTNHRGEIAALAEIAQPSIGVVTNVGTAHIEHLGSQDGIAIEKGDLIAALGAQDVAVLNADDPRVAAMADRTPARKVSFGRSAAADVRAENVRARAEGGFELNLVTPDGEIALELSGLAEVTIDNALAAAAAALAAGASLDDVREGLRKHGAVSGRMEQIRLPSGVTLINDSYNANPQSTAEALRTLQRLKGEASGFAVLGDMGELGDTANSAHTETGRLAAELGIDWLLALGEHANELGDGATAAGMPDDHVRIGTDHADLVEQLRQLAGDGDWILVKGSRSMQMEKIVSGLAREALEE